MSYLMLILLIIGLAALGGFNGRGQGDTLRRSHELTRDE